MKTKHENLSKLRFAKCRDLSACGFDHPCASSQFPPSAPFDCADYPEHSLNLKFAGCRSLTLETTTRSSSAGVAWLHLPRGEFDDPQDLSVGMLRRRIRLRRDPSRHCQRSASLRSFVGANVQHSRLGSFLPLSLRVLSAKLLGQRVLSKCRQPLPPLSTRDAHTGLQPTLAQLLSNATEVPLGSSLRARRILSRPTLSRPTLSRLSCFRTIAQQRRPIA